MIGAPIGTAIGGVHVAVTEPTQLPDALNQRTKPVVIENEEMARTFLRLQKWQSRENTYRIMAMLVASILALAIANKYKIDLSWRANWKLETLDGRVTLTPMNK